MFQKMRGKMKTVVIIVLVAMFGGVLWAGGSALFGGGQAVPAEATTVVATVNGQGITLYDLYRTFIRQLQQLEQQQGSVPGRSYEAVRYQALESLVNSVVVSQEMAKRNLTASKAEVDAELQQIINLFSSEDEYKEQLKLAGLTEEQFRAQLAEEVKFEKFQKEIIGDLAVSEQEIKDLYEQVRVSHILISPAGLTDEDWTVAEGRAWEVYAQVDVDNFAEVAETVSEDASATRGGDLGYISKGQTVPEFENTAFSLAVGQISEPVRSAYGYHIITVTDRKDAEGEEFEKVRPLLEDLIRNEKGQADLLAWIEKARSEAEVVYLDYPMNAFAQLQAENYEEAAHYYKLALEQQPDDGYLYASLGDVYYNMGDLDQAIAQYELATEKYSTDHTLFMELGSLYHEAERIDEAVEAYLKASEVVPDDIFAQLALYQYVTMLDRPEEAKVIEQRIEEFQERQNELLRAQQAAAEEAEAETDPVEESTEGSAQ
ncbi:MAG: tetratricopeptide repeat protein [Firmicutes bacterium]|nr:tetratricopeptide repeat protein [Bacillota bacterium]